MKLKITQIYRNTKDKQGNPLINKMGRPYEKVAIKTEEYKDRYVSGFGGDWNLNWKIGDIVNIRLEEVGNYLNFSRLSEVDELKEVIEKIDDRLKELENFICKGNQGEPEIGGHVEEVNPEDLPF